ncbi:hypothetical protein THOD04_50089 [Vibrio owensii]|nr:hypothetical protein THOD04_50089 [Vibrio owensii]
MDEREKFTLLSSLSMFLMKLIISTVDMLIIKIPIMEKIIEDRRMYFLFSNFVSLLFIFKYASVSRISQVFNNS